jgi:predicted transcriptional regulator
MKLGSPCLRVVMGICFFIESHILGTKSVAASNLSHTIDMPITQEILASLCGVSRSRFSSFIHLLEKGGWVSTAYGRIKILRVDVWLRFSERQRSQMSGFYNTTMAELLNSLEAAHQTVMWSGQCNGTSAYAG